MRTYDVSGEWSVSFERDGERRTIPATVPGNVAVDLIREGIVPDLYVGAHALQGREWEHTDFTYETRFDLPEHAADERVILVLQGVDTAADIAINGWPVAFVQNMFIAHRIDITDTPGLQSVNTLTISIRSPLQHAARLTSEYGRDAVEMEAFGNHEALALRKAHHMYGWDIAPRLLFGGVWRPVHLEVLGASRIVRDDVYLYTVELGADHTVATLGLQWGLTMRAATRWSDYQLTITGRCGQSSFEHTITPGFTRGRERISVSSPELWWPAGYGPANLYDVTLTLTYQGQEIDRYDMRIGIRTVSLDFHVGQTPDESRFGFIVNGQPVCLHGSNWVPADALHATDRARIQRIMPMFTDTHCNITRCWGGGVYEDDVFYDYCDAHGILVWQDFMFACAYYPQNEPFQSVIANEAETVIRRLRNHPCLALWAGDNEIDEALTWTNLGNYKPSQNVLSRQVLKTAVYRLDPYREYLPSSPYITDETFTARRRDLLPEQHLWGPRGYFKDEFYANNTAKFASEIGYHGMPARSSMERFLSADKVWGSYNNAEWILHAADFTAREDGPMGQRNFLMLNQVKHLFGDSVDCDNLDDFIAASQITQAEAKKYFIEMFRAGKPQRTGIIWWNMIDCWPQFSDAVVDYYYAKKLAYDYIKRSQTPVCVMIVEQGADRRVVAVNDTLQAVEGEWAVADAVSGRRLCGGALALPSNGVASLGEIPATHTMQFARITWSANGQPGENHYVNGAAPWSFAQYRAWQAG